VDDATGMGELPSAASSNEDFWMFFTFAMVLLVFVLMNYVNYLNSLVVKAPSKAPAAAVEATPPAEPAQNELHVIVSATPQGASYRIAEAPAAVELQDQAALLEGLRQVVPSLAGPPPYQLHIHAPGNVLYQHVFDASFAATQLTEERPEWEFVVHLVYEERQ
jgi:hypothetical protein